MIINIFNVLTNWSFLFYSDHKFILSIPAVISSLMHLSETKHHLSCVPFFDHYTNIFLNLDRIMSYVLGSYMTYRWYFCGIIAPWHLIVPGLICVALGERIRFKSVRRQILFDRYVFPVLHTIWHLCAFKIMDMMLF